MSFLDFSNEETGRSFDLLPDKTVAHVVLSLEPGKEGTPENAFTVTNSGLLMLRLCATITEGQFAGRKFWQNLLLGATKGTVPSEGQQKAINIARSLVRQLLEAGRGVEPSDESAAAVQARSMTSVHELEGLEMWVTIGIDKSKDPQYSDQNRIARVHPYKKGAAPPTATDGKPAAPGAKPPAGAAPKKPSWA
jgi:hypothetical protein